MATTIPTPPTATELLQKKRPSPRVAQMKRTMYFLSRNTLAMVGLAIIVIFALIAVYGVFYPAPWTQMQDLCGTDTGNGFQQNTCSVCTYDTYLPPPTNRSPSACYQVSSLSPSVIGPTFSLKTLSLGPLPLGSLAVSPSSNSQMYNIYAGLVKGAPWSLSISIIIVGAGAGIGLLLGSVAGFRGGYTDELIMRITDVFLSIPALLLALVMVFALASVVHTVVGRIFVLVGAFIITWWPFYTRLVRGQVLVTREMKYVESARASGSKTGRLLRKHIIPNSLYPVFVQMSLDVGSIPILLGGIVYLGFPIWSTPYFPEWGTISALALGSIPGLLLQCLNSTTGCNFPWWQVLFPGLTVFLFAISVNFLSDGLRDALDPRLRR